jgi:hypothetical protein
MMRLFMKTPRVFSINGAGNLNDGPQSHLGEVAASVFRLNHRAGGVVVIFRHHDSRFGAEM